MADNEQIIYRPHDCHIMLPIGEGPAHELCGEPAARDVYMPRPGWWCPVCAEHVQEARDNGWTIRHHVIRRAASTI
jgi:hypothetical protein